MNTILNRDNFSSNLNIMLEELSQYKDNRKKLYVDYIALRLNESLKSYNDELESTIQSLSSSVIANKLLKKISD